MALLDKTLRLKLTMAVTIVLSISLGKMFFALRFIFQGKYSVLIDHILSESICLFCFCVLFSKVYSKIKITIKIGLTYDIFIIKLFFYLFFILFIFLFYFIFIFYFIFFFFFLEFLTKKIIFFYISLLIFNY